MFQDKHICVIAKDICPETDDATKPKYCPFYKIGIPDIETDGSGRLISTKLYTGCSIYKILPYIVAGIAEADHAHKAANEARDTCMEIAKPTKKLNECFESLIGLSQIQLTKDQMPVHNVKELTE